MNGEPTVLLTIRRQSGTNTVQVVDAVRERLADVAPLAPAGLRRSASSATSRSSSRRRSTASRSTSSLGSILAALVVLVFLWNWRSTIIAAIAIPTSIIATFGLIWYQGFTLNSMTLLALTLAVGIVIDDAIVVLENIYRFVEEKGRPPMQAAVEATREIGLAVLATTLSLVAIFVPVGFMGGIVGRFMTSFGFTMSFAILVSLLVSFTLTPMLSARWIKMKPRREDAEGHEIAERRRRSRGSSGPLDRGYAPDAAVVAGAPRGRRRHRRAGAARAACRCSWSPTRTSCRTTTSRSSRSASARRRARASRRRSSSPTGSRRRSAQLPEVDYTLVTVADDPARTQNSGTIYVRLKPVDERDARSVRRDGRGARRACCRSSRRPNLRTGVRPVATIGGGGNQNAEIQFTINGPDLDSARDVTPAPSPTARKKQPGVVDVDTSLNVGKPELSVHLDRLKAADLGVQVADAAEALRLLVGGDQVTTYNEGGEQYEVHVRARRGRPRRRRRRSAS